MKIRIGHLSTFYHTALLLLARRDIDSRLQAETEWRLFGTGPAIMQAIERTELDLAYIGLPPAMIGIARAVPVVCIAGGHVEGTVISAKAAWKGFPEETDLRTVLQQFRGGKIGVPARGSIHDVILRDCLGRAGLSDEVEVRNYAWADLISEAVVRGEVQAATGTPALAAAVKRFAQGRVLVPASRLWPNNPSYGIIARLDFLQNHADKVERFLRLHEEETALLRNQPEEAAARIAGLVGIVDAPFVLDAIGISPRYCAKLSDAFIESSMKFEPVLRQLGYIEREIGPDRIFDRSLIDRVHPERDHYGEGADANA